MRCPWCGGPVRLYGAEWRCRWCDNVGVVGNAPVYEPEQVTLTISFVYHVDLSEVWSELKKALDLIAPGRETLSRLLGKVLLHSISAGLSRAGDLPDEKKEELRTFLSSTPDLNLGKSAEEIMRAAERDVLFGEEAGLSENDCGTFWTELISLSPAEDYYNNLKPDGLFELMSELSAAYAYFGAEKDSESGEAQDCRIAMEEAYNAHWQNRVLLHPDVERAKRLLSEGSFPSCEDICREILLVEYPEEVPHETAEDFNELSWERILDDVFACDAAKGLEMWRFLLDAAEPSLKADAGTAEKLLPDWSWLDCPRAGQKAPLLAALRDERFASQLFESASLGRMQLDILDICREEGENELGRHCLELALRNPCLEDSWEKRYRRAFSDASSSKGTRHRTYAANKPAAAGTDDGTVFHYCSVQIKGMSRPYAYLTGGLQLKVGDWVELPFGNDNAPRHGQVKAVMDCTRMAAPWPPEKTKTVIRLTDAPPAGQTADTAAPQPERPAEHTVKQPEREEKPVISEQSAEIIQPEAEVRSSESAAADGEQSKPAAQRKRFPLSRLIAAAIIVIAAAVVSMAAVNHSRRQAEAYAEALMELSNGDYAAAEQSFSDISGYRDSAPLSVYCKYANIYKDRTDYVGGQHELSDINLQFDKGWQQDVDALKSLVSGYKAEKDAEEKAELERIAAEKEERREEQLKELYSGKLPVEGMPVSALKYTQLGEPAKRVNCDNYETLGQNRKYYIVYWYNGDGEMIAAGMCGQCRDDTEDMLKSFSRYYPSGSGNTISSGEQSGNYGSVREIYDNPEDLWEDNRDLYEDEDEAWDEWYDGMG